MEEPGEIAAGRVKYGVLPNEEELALEAGQTGGFFYLLDLVTGALRTPSWLS